MQQTRLSKRMIANARLQAEVRAAQEDKPLIDELNAEARKLGFRGWNRLITVYRAKETQP